MKLGLGTVAFAAQTGKHALSVAQDTVREILVRAHQAGMTLLDTAAEAGDSLAVVGASLPAMGRFNIVVKPHLASVDSGAATYADQLEHGVLEALQILGQPSVYALKITLNPSLMNRQGERLIHRMESLKRQGLIEKTAFSIAQTEGVDWLLGEYQPDIVQLPVSVLDQRFVRGGQLRTLKARQVEVHARDILLQGVLLDPLHLHPWFWPLKKIMAQYHDFLIQEGFTPLEGALNFVTAIPEVDFALVGVHSLSQLDEMLAALTPRVAVDDFFPFASPDARYVDPLQWNLYE